MDFLKNVGSFAKGFLDHGCKYECYSDSTQSTRTRKIPSGRQPQFNGCGTEGLQEVWHLDQKFTDAATRCCNEHDICYDTCGIQKLHKQRCDDTFQHCLLEVCQRGNILHDNDDEENKESCDGTANMMHAAVAGFGCHAYLESQTDACTCLDEQVDQKDRYPRSTRTTRKESNRSRRKADDF